MHYERALDLCLPPKASLVVPAQAAGICSRLSELFLQLGDETGAADFAARAVAFLPTADVLLAPQRLRALDTLRRLLTRTLPPKPGAGRTEALQRVVGVCVELAAAAAVCGDDRTQGRAFMRLAILYDLPGPAWDAHARDKAIEYYSRAIELLGNVPGVVPATHPSFSTSDVREAAGPLPPASTSPAHGVDDTWLASLLLPPPAMFAVPAPVAPLSETEAPGPVSLVVSPARPVPENAPKTRPRMFSPLVHRAQVASPAPAATVAAASAGGGWIREHTLAGMVNAGPDFLPDLSSAQRRLNELQTARAAEMTSPAPAPIETAKSSASTSSLVAEPTSAGVKRPSNASKGSAAAASKSNKDCRVS
jgi:hypothetical protein